MSTVSSINQIAPSWLPSLPNIKNLFSQTVLKIVGLSKSFFSVIKKDSIKIGKAIAHYAPIVTRFIAGNIKKRTLTTVSFLASHPQLLIGFGIGATTIALISYINYPVNIRK